MAERTAGNPFTISFGMEPSQYIERFSQLEEIESTFLSEEPASRIFMISGVRGSGKTVMLSTVSERFSKKKNCLFF